MDRFVWNKAINSTNEMFRLIWYSLSLVRGVFFLFSNIDARSHDAFIYWLNALMNIALIVQTAAKLYI